MLQNGYAWYFSLYFQLLQRLTCENRGLAALAIIWAGELQKQLCKQSSLLPYDMLLLFQSYWGLKKKRKKETKQNKKAQTLPISLMTYLSPSLLFWMWASWTGVPKHYPAESIYCILWKLNHGWKTSLLSPLHIWIFTKSHWNRPIPSGSKIKTCSLTQQFGSIWIWLLKKYYSTESKQLCLRW